MREAITTGRDDLVHTLHEVLERDNSLSRCQAARALEHLKARDPESRSRLIALLLDPEPDVRIDVADTLGKLGIEDAAEALIANLRNDPDGDVRIQAVTALAQLGSKQATDALVHCFVNAGYPQLDVQFDDMEYNASIEIHGRALAALGDIGDATVVGPVIELLRDETYSDLQESGFAVLARLNSAPARAFLLDRMRNGESRARRRAIQALAKAVAGKTAGYDCSAGIFDAITEALLDEDPHVRIAAAKALGDNNHQPAVVPLTLMLLRDPAAEVKKQVISVLGRMTGPRIIDRLLALLDQAPRVLKPDIVRALGESGDAKSLEPLTALLDSEDELLLREVVSALGKIGEPGPESKIAGLLENPENPLAVRVQAAQSLQRLVKIPRREERGEEPTQDQEAEPSYPERVLEGALFDKQDAVRLAAMSALVEIDPDTAADRLTGLLRGDLKSAAPAPVSEAEPPIREEPEVSPEVAELLEGEVAETSTLASIMASSVARRPEPAEDPVQAQPQAAPDRATRILAARLLRQIPGAGPDTVAALEELTRDPDIDLKREAYLTLGWIGDVGSLAVVQEGLADDDPEIRLSALVALGGFQDVDLAGDKIAGLLADPDAFVRRRAIEKLARFDGPLVTKYLPLALGDEDREVCRAALKAVPEGAGAEQLSDRITDLIFEFAGDLRTDAAMALRRIGGAGGAAKLLAILEDDAQEEVHWICIDALPELYAGNQAQGVEL